MARDHPRSGHVSVIRAKALELPATTNEIKPLYSVRVKCTSSKILPTNGEGTVGRPQTPITGTKWRKQVLGTQEHKSDDFGGLDQVERPALGVEADCLSYLFIR